MKLGSATGRGCSIILLGDTQVCIADSSVKGKRPASPAAIRWRVKRAVPGSAMTGAESGTAQSLRHRQKAEISRKRFNRFYELQASKVGRHY
jgi:hypothetical protein